MSSADEKTLIQNLDQVMLKDAERKFKKSCAQICFLNKQLQDTQARYQKAKRDNFKCFRYNLRLKLAVVEGTRNMYYEYAYMQAEIVADLRHKLYGQNVDIVTSESEESDDSDMETDEYSV